MGAVIPVWILRYGGQVIKEVRQDETMYKITVTCRRSSAAEDWQPGPRANASSIHRRPRIACSRRARSSSLNRRAAIGNSSRSSRCM
jgi:hypothetical protein